ncbi:hypothetical protein GWK47_046199 [Chionoecetes opilio]|uniref:Uncharacterized protein n=1 Tax=Chionoecetes opilio TaxID=41210 RepID=A0A8J4YEV0_CHIOP|nr:hypothetical protein GWK47_046199 [Chionoecetes opilio]
MVVSPVPCAGHSGRRLRFGWRSSPTPGSRIKVLGVEVDRELRFDGHINHIAKKASHRVSALRREASFLDRGRGNSCLQGPDTALLRYAALSWMSCAVSHTRRLDSSSVEPCDWGMLHTPQPNPSWWGLLDSLEQRRDGRGAWVFHKAQVQGVPHLVGLRQPFPESPREARERCLPVVMQWRCRVLVPARTNHLCWLRLRVVEHFHGRRPHIQEFKNTKCKVLGANSWETVKAHPADASDYVTLSDINSASAAGASPTNTPAAATVGPRRGPTREKACSVGGERGIYETKSSASFHQC